MPRLVISAPNEPRRDVLLADEVTIGRGQDNVLVLGDDAVSTAHARILVGRQATWIEDLGSTNGTLVGGQRVPARQRVKLAAGDHVAIGPYILSLAGDAALDRSLADDDIAPSPRNGRAGQPRPVRVLQVVALVAVLAALASVVLKRLL